MLAIAPSVEIDPIRDSKRNRCYEVVSALGSSMRTRLVESAHAFVLCAPFAAYARSAGAKKSINSSLTRSASS